MRMSVQDKLELEIDEIVAHECGYKSLFAFSFFVAWCQTGKRSNEEMKKLGTILKRRAEVRAELLRTKRKYRKLQ